MTCRYRIGDALAVAVMLLVVFALTIRLGVVEHAGWFTASGSMLISMIVGTYLNSKERNREVVREVRAQRQISLGVPPDEV